MAMRGTCAPPRYALRKALLLRKSAKEVSGDLMQSLGSRGQHLARAPDTGQGNMNRPQATYGAYAKARHVGRNRKKLDLLATYWRHWSRVAVKSRQRAGTLAFLAISKYLARDCGSGLVLSVRGGREGTDEVKMRMMMGGKSIRRDRFEGQKHFQATTYIT